MKKIKQLERKKGPSFKEQHQQQLKKKLQIHKELFLFC